MTNRIKRTASSTRPLAVLLGVLSLLALGAAVPAFAAGPPAPTITSKPPNPSDDTQSATFAFTDTQAGVTFLCSLDGAAFASCTSPTSYSGLTQGAHTFKVEAKDASNKIGAATSYNWSVNLTPPAPTITTKPSNPSTSTSATFEFTDAWPGVTYTCSLDGAAFAACTSPVTYSGLAAGDRNFKVKASKYGFTSPQTEYRWKIQPAPAPPAPTITATPTNPTADTSASFSFTDTQAGVTFLCSLDGSAYTACTSPKSYPGPLSAGSHTFAVEAQASGTSAPTSFTWTIDTTAPAITVTFPTNGSVYTAAAWNAGCSGGAGICGSATDPSGVAGGAVSILQSSSGKYWDGTAFASSTEVFDIATQTGGSGTTFTGRYPLALPPDGAYTVHVRAQDNLGNTTAPAQQVVVNFTIDATPPPAPAITATPPSITPSTSASFSFTDGEAAVTFQCKLDAGAYTSCTSPKSYSGLAAGSHTFSVQALDGAGNISAATSYAWTVGVPPPSITANPANPTNLTTASFSFTDTDAAATFLCSLDAGSYASCASPKSYTGLAAGSHTFRVEAKDGTLVSAPTTFTWTVDLTAPPAPSITAKPTNPSNTASPSFSFTDGEAGVTFLCKLDGGSYAACSSPKSYSGLAAGPHTFSVEARDAAGNVSSATSSTWTIDLTPPPAPAIGTKPPALTTSTSATFSFTDTELGVTFVCQLDIGMYTSCTSPKSYSGLSDATHTFYVEAIDAAGNASAPAQYTWTVDTTPPPAPTITAQPANPTNVTTASFSFTDAEAGVTFQCKLDSSSYVACSSPQSYPGLAAGSHTFSVRATDAAGNVGTATSSAWTIDLTPPPAPTFNSTPANPTNQTSATFDVSDAKSGVTYLCRLDGGSFTPCPDPVTYAGPLGEGSHTFQVEAKDPAGNVGPAATYTWVIDTTPPPAPSITSNPPGPSGSPSATFAFADAEAGVTLQCKLDGGAFAACTSPKSYSGLADGSHTFAVRALDAAGNPSGAPAYTWTVDTTPPPKPVLTSAPDDPSFSTTATFEFTDAEAGVTFLCKIEPAAFAPCTSPITYTSLPLGDREFKVRAVDAAGNVGPELVFKWKIKSASGQPFTISGNATSTLYPGGAASPIELTFENPNTSPITITDVTVTVTGTTAAGCGAGNFQVTQQLTATPVVPANSTKSLTDLGVPQSQWPKVQMLDSGNQDACKSATVHLDYAGNATG
jgi:hypothetical protein